jgi:16S rRNA (guanine(1405)-N(7))-methyltransferase
VARTDADDLAQRILSSAKYRSLDQALVHRVATEAAQRCRDRAQAVKYAKRKLHQAFGAFLNGSPAPAVNAMVEAVRAGADPRVAALAAMRTHASAAERVDWLEPFYLQVAEWCGTPGSVVDLACGLNPLAIPWMLLAPDTSYRAYEIDRDVVAALAGLDDVLPVTVAASTCDLVAAAPPVSAELTLLLKTVTTLEQQDAGAAARVLSEVDSAHVVVSLPRRSLSGRREYADDADAIVGQVLAGGRYRLADQAAFGTESLYHLVPWGQAPRRDQSSPR